MDGKQLQNQYKDHLSDYKKWEQKENAADYILYPKNIGHRLCTDEAVLSKGEFHTIIIKKGKGRKGSIVTVIKGTKAEDIIAVLM